VFIRRTICYDTGNRAGIPPALQKARSVRCCIVSGSADARATEWYLRLWGLPLCPVGL
jgi:hypothetical protein